MTRAQPTPPAGSRSSTSHRFHCRASRAHEYEVLVERGLLGRCGRRLREVAGERDLCILTDRNVERLYGPALRQSLDDADLRHQLIVIEPGEESKSLPTYARLLEEMAELSVDRGALVLNFGGGVVSDLGGFLASTYMRGIDYVNVPTTLLAQVDASVGGKVAVNAKVAKNLVGAFHHPTWVGIDPQLLSSLAAREYRAGLAEIVKVAILGAPDLFELLENEVEGVEARAEELLVRVIGRAAEAKMVEVDLDPYEAELRRPLNLGHTIAHPIETEFGYRCIRHGEAVAVGLGVATSVALAKKITDAETARRIWSLLAAFGILGFTRRIEATRVVEHMRYVRLIRGKALHFVLPAEIGRVVITEDVTDRDLIDGFAHFDGVVEQYGGAMMGETLASASERAT